MKPWTSARSEPADGRAVIPPSGRRQYRLPILVDNVTASSPFAQRWWTRGWLAELRMRILAGRVLPCAEIHVLRRPFECSGVKLKRLRVRGVVPGVAVGGERVANGPAHRC